MSETIKKTEEIICKKLKVKSIDTDKELRSLGLDSLDVVEILLTLEDELHVEFTSDELKKLKKVSDLYSAIEAKIASSKK